MKSQYSLIILLSLFLFFAGCNDASQSVAEQPVAAEQTVVGKHNNLPKDVAKEQVATDVSMFQRVDRAAIPEALRQLRPGTYPVTIEPAGTWYVEAAPQRFVASQATEIDIALSLGCLQQMVAGFDFNKSARRLRERFYNQLPGVDAMPAPGSLLPLSSGVDQELFLQLRPDCYIVDPRRVYVAWHWSPEQMATQARRTGPFMGNFIRFGRDKRWGPAYTQYTLDEYHQRLATMFQREQRYQQLTVLHKQLLNKIKKQLPPAGKRPRICLLNAGSEPDKGKFYVVDMWGRERGHSDKDTRNQGGSWIQQYHELGLQQAYDFPGLDSGQWGTCDYETLLKIDPPVIIIIWAYLFCDTEEDFNQRYLEPLRRSPLGSRLQAVRNNCVFPGGTAEQGPIAALFQLEMAAKQLFPEKFGTWQWDGSIQQPLFARSAVADIILGKAND